MFGRISENVEDRLLSEEELVNRLFPIVIHKCMNMSCLNSEVFAAVRV